MKIFIIEDDQFIARTMTAALLKSKKLKKFSPEISHFPNPIEALRVMGEIKPDVIILDIMMPEMTGMEFLEFIDYGPKTGFEVIIITAYPSEDTILKAAARGIDSFFSKPFSVFDVIDIVEQVGLSKGGE